MGDTHTPSIQELHDRVMESNDFTPLEKYSAASSWESLDAEERELLSSLFVLKGEVALESGTGSPVEAFETAQQILPEDPRLLVWLAMLYLTGDEEGEGIYEKAKECARSALKLDPTFAQAHQVLAGILVSQGEEEPSIEAIEEALEHYKKFEVLEKEIQSNGNHWWERGRAEMVLGIAKGDAVQARAAIDCFRKANKAGIDNALFWTEFGDALFHLGMILGNPSLIQEAADDFDKVIKMEPDYPGAWMRYAVSLSRLAVMRGGDTRFKAADEAFSKATQRDGEEGEIWYEWGLLYFQRAQETRDLDLAQQACDKFASADLFETDRPENLGPWITALVLIGLAKEQLEFLREAEEKAKRLVNIDKHDPVSWGTYAYVYYALGQYFGDEEYYQQAIQGAEVSLSLDPEGILAWGNLAQTYLAIAESRGDLEAFKKGERAYAKIFELSPNQPPKSWQEWGTCALGIGTLIHDVEWVQLAAEHFEEARRLEQEAGEAEYQTLLKLGTCYSWLGEQEEDEEALLRAAEILTTASETDPEDPGAWFGLGLTYSNLAGVEGDIELYERAILCFEKTTQIDVEESLAYLEWGIALIHMSQMTDYALNRDKVNEWCLVAEEKLARAAQLGSGEALYTLACLYVMGGRLDWGMELLYKAKDAEVLPPIEELAEDEWLDRIRGTAEFEAFLNEVMSSEPEED